MRRLHDYSARLQGRGEDVTGAGGHVLHPGQLQRDKREGLLARHCQYPSSRDLGVKVELFDFSSDDGRNLRISCSAAKHREIRIRLSRALNNVVNSELAGRNSRKREAKVLKLLETLRMFCDVLRDLRLAISSAVESRAASVNNLQMLANRGCGQMFLQLRDHMEPGEYRIYFDSKSSLPCSHCNGPNPPFTSAANNAYLLPLRCFRTDHFQHTSLRGDAVIAYVHTRSIFATTPVPRFSFNLLFLHSLALCS